MSVQVVCVYAYCFVLQACNWAVRNAPGYMDLLQVGIDSSFVMRLIENSDEKRNYYWI